MDIVTLASMVVEHDSEKVCPYCFKIDWGKELHADYCVFAVCYKILNEEKQKQKGGDEK